MIYRETGADIILSSTWRLWENNTGRDAVDKAHSGNRRPAFDIEGSEDLVSEGVSFSMDVKVF